MCGTGRPALSQNDEAGAGAAPLPVEVAEGGWESVGGHGEVVKQLKEMVMLPLQYPDLFSHMGVTPPR